MGENRTRQEQTESERQQQEEYLFSKLAYKIKANKNHVMDGYQKGHMVIQAGGLKTNNNNINAREKKNKNTVQNKTWADNKLKQMAYMNLSYTHTISYTQNKLLPRTEPNPNVTVFTRLAA